MHLSKQHVGHEVQRRAVRLQLVLCLQRTQLVDYVGPLASSSSSSVANQVFPLTVTSVVGSDVTASLSTVDGHDTPV